jgi:hypothetical protein
MSETRDIVGAAFADLEETVMRQTRLAGIEAAYSTVRRRRRNRLVVVAAVTLIVVLAPIAAFALARGTGFSPPDVGTSPSPSVVVSPSPTTTPSGPPAMRIVDDEYATPLDDVLLPVPDFGRQECANGPVQFHSGEWLGSADETGFRPSIVIDEAVTGDVNGDGAADQVAILRCIAGPIQGNSKSEVVAYTNVAGTYALIGRVFLADEFTMLSEPQVQSDTTVRVVLYGPVEPVSAAKRQWHTFRWTGASFQPVGQPVDVVVVDEPTNLSVTATAPAVAGGRTALAVTVHNGGPVRSDYLLVSLRSTVPFTVRADGLASSLLPRGCDTYFGCVWAVRVEMLGAGQSATGTFTIEAPGGADGEADLTVSVYGWLVGQGYQMNADDANTVTVPIRME